MKIALRLSARLAGTVTTTITVAGETKATIPMSAGSIAYDANSGQYYADSYGNGEWANTQMVELELENGVSQELVFTTEWEMDSGDAAFAELDPNEPNIYQGLNFPSAGCLSYWLDPGSGAYVRFEMSSLSQLIYDGRNVARLQVKLGDGVTTDTLGDSSGPVAGVNGPFPPRSDYLDPKPLPSRFAVAARPVVAMADSVKVPARRLPSPPTAGAAVATAVATPQQARAVFQQVESLPTSRFPVPGPIQKGATLSLGAHRTAADLVVIAGAPATNAAPAPSVAAAPIGSLYLPIKLGGDQGRLFFSTAAINSAAYSPGRLSASSADRVVHRIADGGGALRQLLLVDAFVDVRTLSGTAFEVRFYSPTQIGAFDSGVGLYPIVDDAPGAVWLVENPDALPTANRVRFTETRNGVTRVHLAAWAAPSGATPGCMTLSLNDGQVVETRTYTLGTLGDANTREERICRRGPGPEGAVASDVTEVWQEFYHWGQPGQVFEALVQRIEDPDGAALETNYIYYDDVNMPANSLHAVTHPDGYWEVYQRFNTGEVWQTYRPYGDTPASPFGEINASECRFTEVAYTDYSTTLQLREETEYVLGAAVRRTLLWKQLEGGMMTETTQRFLSENQFIETQQVITSHREAALFELSEAGATRQRLTQLGWWNPQAKTFTQNWSTTLPKARRTFVIHGSLDHVDGVANRTLIDVTVENEHGHAVCEEQFVNTTGGLPDPYAWTRTDAISREVRSYNARGLLTAVERNGAVVFEAGYLGDGKLDWETDESGVRTAYTYDAFGRVETKVRSFGADDSEQTATLVYDSAGRLRFETLSAIKAGVTSSLTTEYRYDLAGRLTHTITPDGLVTAIAEEMVLDAESNQPMAKRVTSTAPSGATISTEYYRDRRLWSTTGSASAPRYFYYNYTTTGDGAFEYAQEYRDAAATEFRQETLTDWLGNTVQTTVPGFRGVGYVTRNATFDGGPGADGSVRGLLSRVTEPGRAATLYEYDEFGRQTAIGLDANANGMLDRSSAEPITLSSLGYERTEGTAPWFRVTRQSALFTSNSATSTTVGESREQLTGLPVGVVSQGEVLGSDGRRVSEKRSMERVTKTSTSERRDMAASASTAAETETTIAGRVRTLRRAGATADVSYTYDSLGRIESVTDPLAGTLTYSYNDSGQLLSVTDSAPTPRVTEYTYHPHGAAGAGQTATATDAAGFVTRYTYTDAGQLHRQWGRNASPSEYGFDDEGRLISLWTFRTQDTQTGGTVDWSADTWPANAPAGDLTQWVYDAASGLLEFKRAADYVEGDAQPIQQSYTYDSALRLRTRTNARGQTATRGYDALGRLATITYSAGSGATNVTLGYDRAGRLSSATDGAGSRAFTVTAFGQPDDEVHTAGPLAGLAVNRSYDSSRRLGGVAVAGAVALAYGYDDYSRLGTVTDTRGAATVAFTYGYTAGTGRVETVEALRAGVLRLTSKRTFDALGRLSGTEARDAANQVLVSHGYTGFDALDRRTQVTREDGKLWDYGYDARGEVTSAAKSFPTDEGGQELHGWSASYLYDSIGNRLAVSDASAMLPAVGSPLRADYVTNAVNEYEQRTVSARLALTGDAAAAAAVTATVNDTSLAVTRQGAAGAQTFWAADWLPANATTPAFGQVRVQAAVLGRAPAGSVGTLFLPQSPEIFIHDRDGNLTADGRWNYTWDAENRLIAMETRPELVQPAGVLPVEQRTKLEFVYDFAGRRVAKRVFAWDTESSLWSPVSDHRFLWDGWSLLAEYTVPLGTSNLSLVRSYTWGLDLSGGFQGAGGVGGLLAVHQSASVCHLPAFDGNGNISTVFDADTMGEVARFDYDAFGRTLQAVGSALAAIPFRFSTKYQDAETGLLYYGLRYYNPSTGRWLSRDPIEEEGGMNLYGMVGNDAVSGFDPLGMYPGVPGHGSAISPDDSVNLIRGAITRANEQYARNSRKALNPYEQDPLKNRLAAIIQIPYYSIGEPALNTDSGNRFVYTCRYGWIDMGHFFRNVHGAVVLGKDATKAGADVTEMGQYHIGARFLRWIGFGKYASKSGYAVEDLVSNQAGRNFGTELTRDTDIVGNWQQFLRGAGAVRWDEASKQAILEDMASYGRLETMPLAKAPEEGSAWQKNRPLWRCLCDGDTPKLEAHRF